MQTHFFRHEHLRLHRRQPGCGNCGLLEKVRSAPWTLYTNIYTGGGEREEVQASGLTNRFRSPDLTCELVAGDVPTVLPGERRLSGGAIYIPRLSLLTQTSEGPRTAKVAATFVERHIWVRLLSHRRWLQSTCVVSMICLGTTHTPHTTIIFVFFATGLCMYSTYTRTGLTREMNTV